LGKNHWESIGLLGSFNVVNVGQFDRQDLLVQKEQSTQGNILGGCSDLLFHGQVGEILPNCIGPQVAWVSHVMETQKVFDVVEIGLFRSGAEVLKSEGLMDPIE
jgi:hypothetical protein